MFSYELPDGGLCTQTFILEDGNIKFNPPVYEQRYTTTIRIIKDPIWKQTFRKIVDFGCAEVSLENHMKYIPSVEHILAVDIDENCLFDNTCKVTPQQSDYLNKRKYPLRIELLKGSIADSVDDLRNTDVVIALEVIEHLYKDVMDKVPENIFGFIQPKLVIISTPNADYNVVFRLKANEFRHIDHKFEWTRNEFQNWTQNICRLYPNYSVAYLGLGNPPIGYETVGHSTQMAIFARNDLLGKDLAVPIDTNMPLSNDVKYKSIFTMDFPHQEVMLSNEEQICQEIKHFISRNKLRQKSMKDRYISLVPWKSFLPKAIELGATKQSLLEILNENGFEIHGKYIVVEEAYCFEDESDEE